MPEAPADTDKQPTKAEVVLTNTPKLTAPAEDIAPEPEEAQPGLTEVLDEAKEQEAGDNEAPLEKEADKKPEKPVGTGRTEIEAIVEQDGIGRAISNLNRMKATTVKEILRDEYPEIDLDGKDPMEMTKREVLDILKDFYTK